MSYSINNNINYVHTEPIILNPTVDITVNRNPIKNYNGKVYLKQNTDFEFRFQNPNSIRLLAKIKINGKLISPSGLIVNSNSTNFLERYLDSDRKFNFKTFMVDDVDETKEQRERNGKIEVDFYKEKTHQIPFKTTITYDGGTPYQPDYNDRWYSNPSTFGGDSVMTPTSFSSNVNTSRSFTSQVETGRVDEGDKSNQKIVEGSGEFEYFPFYTGKFQILPESHRPQEMSQIRNYCSECGMRIRKSSWKFCPQCGKKH